MGLLPIAAALLVTGPAPDALTPDGPATLRDTWLGAVPSIHYPPRVVVRWRVQVGEGGSAGPVALRVLTGNPHLAEAKALQLGPAEQLPATPGVYEFPARLRFLNGDEIGLDQQTGRHAIVAQHEDSDAERFVDPYELNAMDVWRPPLGDGETRGGYERIQGAQLLVTGQLEYDVDGDGYGDKTQDENDLAITASAGRRTVRVTLRNRGGRPVHRPHLLVRMRGARLLNGAHDPSLRAERGYRRVDVRRIAAGGTRTVFLRASRPGFRVKVVAGSEGFDPTRAALVTRGRSG